MKTDRAALQVNFIAIVLILGIIALFKDSASSIRLLFLPPPSPSFSAERLFTHTFQILCAVPPIICTFSWAILRQLQSEAKMNRFILGSAILTGGFLLNEIYRLHILFLVAGIPKLMTCAIYAVVFGAYIGLFRRFFRSTPYPLLIWSMSLLAFGIAVDTLQPGSPQLSVLLEGIPKLLSEVNVVLYFWYVCRREVLRALV